MIEITGEALSVSLSAVSIGQGENSADIAINSAVGAVSAVVKTSAGATYDKVSAIVSGDNDRVIVSAADDAAAGIYTVTLTDTNSQSASITVVVTE